MVDSRDTLDRMAMMMQEVANIEASISKQIEAKKLKKEENENQKVVTKSQEKADLLRLLQMMEQLDQMMEQLESLRVHENQTKENLTALKEDLREGRYFAKADEIFPRDKVVFRTKEDFGGAADKMMRENAPSVTKKAPPEPDATSETPAIAMPLPQYQQLLDGLHAHLAPGAPPSVTNTSSVSSVASEQSQQDNGGGSVAGKTKDLVGKRAAASAGGGSEANGEEKGGAGYRAKGRECVVPDIDDVELAHQVPDAPSCYVWWSLVCAWAVGKDAKLEVAYKAIEDETDPETRKKLEEKVILAIIQLVSGTKSKRAGMKSLLRNKLVVPKPHARYYDTGYNWIIVPILTLKQILNWKGGRYKVAIFVGEHAPDMTEEDINQNWFQDGPTKFSATTAEKQLLGSVKPNNIDICTTEDLEKVTDVLKYFLEAFADLHTRSCNDDGTRAAKVSPRKWGIIDTAAVVKEVMSPPGKPDDTLSFAYTQSMAGIQNLIDRLSPGKGGGIRVPVAPDTNSFNGGKHVFKSEVVQDCVPDPELVAAKGVLNFSRQRGMRFLPGCPPEESDLNSSLLSDEGLSMVTPLQSTDFIGCNIATVVTPDPPSPDKHWTITDRDDVDVFSDALSDISTED